MSSFTDHITRHGAYVARAALIAGAVVAHAHLASAQATPDSTKRLKGVVVTATPDKRPSEITLESKGLPTQVTIVSHEELERTNVGLDAGTMLRRVPGVMAHNLGQGDIGNSIKMRGFATSTHGADVAVYVDGMPQNVPSSAVAHGINDMNWLTPDMIERIEVIKGPFSALYGDQARAGAVNIITRNSGINSLAGTHGSFDTNRGSAVFSGTMGRLTSFLVGDRIKAQGYRNNADENRGSMFLKESINGFGGTWAARGTYYKSQWNAPGFLNINGLLSGPVRPTDRDTTVPPLYGDAKRANFTLTRVPESGDAGLHLTAFSEDYKRSRALGANRTDINLANDDRRITGARALENLMFGDIAALAFGADTRRDRGDAINRRLPGGQPGPNFNLDQDLNLLTYGLFAQGQIKPIEQVKITGGIRVDEFDYDINNRKLPAASVKYKKGLTTPRVGIVVTPIERLELYANYGQGFRSPNQAEISTSGSVGPLGATGGFAYPDLAVARVNSRDYGFNVYATNRFQFSMAGYHTLNENEIIQVTPGVFQTIGSTTRDGYEVDSRLTVSDAVNAYASYGRILRAQINNPLPGTADRLIVPAHTLKGGVGYTKYLGANRMLLNGDASYISSAPVFSGTPLVLQYGRQYTRFDGRATFELQQRLQLTGYVTSQPVEYSSEVQVSSATGTVVEPRPRSEIGINVRYLFGRM